MNRRITYDSVADRLVFLMSAPDQDYWERLWTPMLSRKNIASGDSFVTKETQRALPRGSIVVDAGCGIGATVYGLKAAGYEAIGLDFAEDTVRKIKGLVPEIDVRVGDVRSLPFPNRSLDGVWSLGVVEHFFEGFGPLMEEKHRVLRKDGMLFLTVPIFSPLKAMRARMGGYPRYESSERQNFFQFAYRPSHMIHSIESFGFKLVRSYGRSGAFGFTEDFPCIARALLLRPDSNSLLSRVWWRFWDVILTPFTAHSRFFLFRKL